MPPPHSIRPLRPCYLPRGTCQVRWASKAATHSRDSPNASDQHHSGHAAVRNDDNPTPLDEPSTSNPAESKRRGWWSLVVGSVSTLISGEPAPARPAVNRSHGEQRATASRDAHSTADTPETNEDASVADAHRTVESGRRQAIRQVHSKKRNGSVAAIAHYNRVLEEKKAQSEQVIKHSGGPDRKAASPKDHRVYVERTNTGGASKHAKLGEKIHQPVERARGWAPAVEDVAGPRIHKFASSKGAAFGGELSREEEPASDTSLQASMVTASQTRMAQDNRPTVGKTRSKLITPIESNQAMSRQPARNIEETPTSASRDEIHRDLQRLLEEVRKLQDKLSSISTSDASMPPITKSVKKQVDTSKELTKAMEPRKAQVPTSAVESMFEKEPKKTMKEETEDERGASEIMAHEQQVTKSKPARLLVNSILAAGGTVGQQDGFTFVRPNFAQSPSSTVVRDLNSPSGSYTSRYKDNQIEASEVSTASKPQNLVEGRSESLSRSPPNSSRKSQDRSGDRDDILQPLARNLHTHSRALKSSGDFDQVSKMSQKSFVNTEVGNLPSSTVEQPSQQPRVIPLETPKHKAAPSTPGPTSEELSELSLLEELFPEATERFEHPQPEPRRATRSYPKLELPKDVLAANVAPKKSEEPRKTAKQRMIEAFQFRGEQTTVLQLSHCSIELTDSDFRRLIPKGKHIESWNRDGEFYKVIPGRDPLSLERQPFYYLLFKSSKAALEYQKNAARLHRLSALNQPSSIFSAVPPPKGFLEDGEDVHAATSSYLLKPPQLPLSLSMVMQPYNAALTALIQRGGYAPIVPDTTLEGKSVFKVLFHIDGWETSNDELYRIFYRHAYERGITWPIHNGVHGISKLRNRINLKQYAPPEDSDDPASRSTGLGGNTYEGGSAERNISQVVMAKVYNRWIIEFEEEEAARRFVLLWHRRILPSLKVEKWKVGEESRICNVEFLW